MSPQLQNVSAQMKRNKYFNRNKKMYYYWVLHYSTVLNKKYGRSGAGSYYTTAVRIINL
eukprot:SAG31_NODE_413_length_15971_cov_7.706842_3_plen_59_part_00